jgi:hypothetical protein
MAALWCELHSKNFGNTETFAILPVANCWSITCRLEALSFPLIAKMKRQEMLPNDFRLLVEWDVFLTIQYHMALTKKTRWGCR